MLAAKVPFANIFAVWVTHTHNEDNFLLGGMEGMNDSRLLLCIVGSNQ